MVIVSFGVMKSASSYQYQVLSELLQARHSSYDDYIDYRTHIVGKEYADKYFEPLYEQFQSNLAKVKNFDFYAFKTHDFVNIPNKEYDTIEELIDRDNLRIIGSIRDPREIMLSAMDHSQRTKKDGTRDFFATLDTIEDTVPHIKNAFQKAVLWHKTKKVLWLPYDSLFEYELEIIVALKDFCGLHHIDIFGRIEKLKSDGHIHQFNKGKKQRWKTELSEEQQIRFSLLFKKEIDFYNAIHRNMTLHFKRYTKYAKRKKSNPIKTTT